MSLYMCITAHVQIMPNNETPEEVKEWLQASLRKLWPLADGSLSLRKGRCIRKSCKACASGQGHPSYALYGRHDGKRFSIYVPDDLAPEIEKALENGRQLQDLMNEAGIRYLNALKRWADVKSRA
jgi:hypothetical protein